MPAALGRCRGATDVIEAAPPAPLPPPPDLFSRTKLCPKLDVKLGTDPPPPPPVVGLMETTDEWLLAVVAAAAAAALTAATAGGEGSEGTLTPPPPLMPLDEEEGAFPSTEGDGLVTDKLEKLGTFDF